MEQQGSARLGGSTVPAPSQICCKVERQLSFSRRHGQLSGLSDSLSSRGRETGGTPGGKVVVLDYRYLASKWDLSSHHALQAGLVWVCDVLEGSDLVSLRALQEALAGRSVGEVAVRGRH